MRYVVGVADMKVSSLRGDEIVTYALGSCLGITIHDSVACVGGMVHVMLPESRIDPAKAAENPCMFVDTGLARLMQEIFKSGAHRERMVVKAAGGACTNGTIDDDYFQIGKRNIVTLKMVLKKYGLNLKAWDVGESFSRTLSLEVGTGRVTVKTRGIAAEL